MTAPAGDEARRPLVLVPRGGAWGDAVAEAARARGLDPVVVPLIVDAPPEDTAALDAALGRLAAAAGRHGAALAHPTRPQGRGLGTVSADSGVSAASADSADTVDNTDGADRAEATRPEGRAFGADHADRADATCPDGPGADTPWLVVTSATTVRAVAGRMTGLPAGVRVACVGGATARAARDAGWPVDLVPQEESAAGLVAAFPRSAGRVLFPRSELAAPTLVEGLRARGIDVEDVVAYRTVGTGDEPVRLDRAPDAVLVTSGSVASQVARRMTPLDPRTRIACIGPGTAASAREAGLPVHVVARSRSADALLDAVAEAIRTEAPEAPEAPRSGRSS